jgi:hypothetical protein
MERSKQIYTSVIFLLVFQQGTCTGVHVDATTAVNLCVGSTVMGIPQGWVLALWAVFHARHLIAIQKYLRSKDNGRASVFRASYVFGPADFAALAAMGIVPTWIEQRAGDLVFVALGCVHMVYNMVSNY